MHNTFYCSCPGSCWHRVRVNRVTRSDFIIVDSKQMEILHVCTIPTSESCPEIRETDLVIHLPINLKTLSGFCPVITVPEMSLCVCYLCLPVRGSWRVSRQTWKARMEKELWILRHHYDPPPGGAEDEELCSELIDCGRIYQVSLHCAGELFGFLV